MDRIRSAKVSIDLSALRHNFQRVKQLSPDCPVMPVIKANAYGHGMLQVAQALSDAEAFAVAQVAEAVWLRQQGIQQEICVFHGFLNEQQLQQCVEYQLRPAISHRHQFVLLQQSILSQPLDIWLKADTGMGRLGLQEAAFADIWKQLSDIKSIRHTGLMMHFANADQPDHALNQQQIDVFKQLADTYRIPLSVSNSAAIAAGLFDGEQTLRPGIMLYGSSPLQNTSHTELDLLPVMQFNAELIAINQMRSQQMIGYGSIYQCPEDMPVGIVNIGYGDGYPRHARCGTPVAVNQQITQLIGRVSMDSIAVDLRGIDARCGDSVELWGQQISVDQVAASADTIAYELLCNVGAACL